MSATAFLHDVSNRRHTSRRIDLRLVPFFDHQHDVLGYDANHFVWPETDLLAERRHHLERRAVLETGIVTKIVQGAMVLVLTFTLIMSLAVRVSESSRPARRPSEIGSPQAYYQWSGYHRVPSQE
jgi:hypothetical protein